MSTAHALDSAAGLFPRKGPARQGAENSRQAVTRRCHDVPSTLMPALRSAIVGSLRAGRSVEQTRKEYNCTAAVAMELWLRDLEKRFAAMARPVAMGACLLILCTGFQAFQEAYGHDEPVSVERAFRPTRARRGRRDGDVVDSIWQSAPEWERAA
jgi:hypothetical protein